jgi:hypothetical protein
VDNWNNLSRSNQILHSHALKCFRFGSAKEQLACWRMVIHVVGFSHRTKPYKARLEFPVRVIQMYILSTATA